MATTLLSNAANNQGIDHQPPMRRSTVQRKPRDSSFPRSKHQKQQPRRGMGVEKLERLRIQESRWKKMTETNIQESIFAHSVKPGGPVTQLQNNQQKFVEEGAGFNGSPSFQGKNVNMVTEINVSDEHCSVCISSKKKRVAGGNPGEMIRSDVLRQMSSFGDSINFPGLKRFGENKDSSVFINQKITSLGIQTYKPPLMPQLGSCAAAVTNTKPVVEIVAVHKKGSAEDGNSTVLMEYEFFPSLKMSNDIKPSEAFCSCRYCDYYYQGNNASSSEASVVDLSLKLWY